MVNLNNTELKQKIIERLDLSNFSPEEQSKILFLLMDNVSCKLNMAILDRLTEDDRRKLQKLSRAGGKKVLNFIGSRVDNFSLLVEGVTKQTVDDFRRVRQLKVNS